MYFDFIIVGQGISGTFLSYYLYKEKKSFVIVDNNDPASPSRVAAGIINPVTGRRMVTVWMADEVMPFAWNAYSEIGNCLGITAISQKNIIDFFPNPFMRENFLKRIREGNEYVHLVGREEQYELNFNYEFGCGEIKPVYVAHLESLLPAWRYKMKLENCLIEGDFDSTQLIIKNVLFQWTAPGGQIMEAPNLIFCDGAGGAQNPWFRQLPFALNKGEALIVEIPGLADTNMYKKSVSLVPLQKEKDLFWVGSNYTWEFVNAEPTDEFRSTTEAALKEWLKIPFKTLEHRAGIRPATVERRPFAGTHPVNKNIGLLNGMGTKGCSLAPFLARQLADHLLHCQPIAAEADVSRFQRILSRKEA